jgi:hypothetical protein
MEHDVESEAWQRRLVVNEVMRALDRKCAEPRAIERLPYEAEGLGAVEIDGRRLLMKMKIELVDHPENSR